MIKFALGLRFKALRRQLMRYSKHHGRQHYIPNIGASEEMECKRVLRSYKMTSDKGFAPNPYAGVLTLATCKPCIRKCPAVMGQWLAGFSSKKLSGDGIGDEKLIYLAKIDGVLPMENYWDAYPEKRSCPSADNIYKKRKGKWILVNDDIHKKKNMKHDLSGKNVLVSHEYYYFGKNALAICSTLRSDIKIPRTSTPYGWLTEGNKAEMFIEWAKENARRMRTIKNQTGVFGEPHDSVMPGGDSGIVDSCGHRNMWSSRENRGSCFQAC